MKNRNNLPLTKNQNRKSVFTRITSLVGAFIVGLLSFVCFVPTDKVNALSYPNYEIYKNWYGGLYDGCSIETYGLANFDSGQVAWLSRLNKLADSTVVSQIKCSADMNGTSTDGKTFGAVSNRYYPSAFTDWAHWLEQSVSTGDFNGNYYLRSMYTGNLSIIQNTPRITYFDYSALTPPNTFIYGYCPGVSLGTYIAERTFVTYRAGFSYRDLNGDLQFIEMGDYCLTHPTGQYIDYNDSTYVMQLNYNTIYQAIVNYAIHQGKVFMFDEMYFDVQCISLADDSDYAKFLDIPEADRYKALFTYKALSPDLFCNANSGSLTDMTTGVVGNYSGMVPTNLYINFPFNNTDYANVRVLTDEASDLWLKQAYADNQGIWAFFGEFFNIELFPNFKLSYLITIGFAILCINLVYKFIVV